MNITNSLEEIISMIHSAKNNFAGDIFIVSIDGMSASGKSTLAEIIAKKFNTDIIHMDDFFLPLDLRTKERFDEIGGNVHYERFKEEVIYHIDKPGAFNYKIFDCSKMEYNGFRNIKDSKLRIVEGSYSQHPYFGDYADLKIFCKITSEEQINRIIKRNGPDKAIRFKNEWIPLEDKYFMSLDLKNNIIFTN